MKIQNNKVVSIEYSVKDKENNQMIDSNVGEKPLEFLFGAGQVISGLEKALLDKVAGDMVQTEIQPEEAYGIYRTDFLQEVPRDQFEGIELQEGMTLFGEGEDGKTVQVVVRGFSDSMVMIDYNHPLAGKTLLFDVKIIEVREPTEEEILQGSVISSESGCCGGDGCCGGKHHHDKDHHDGGGCCGGHHH